MVYLLKIVIFYSYVKLPEGIGNDFYENWLVVTGPFGLLFHSVGQVIIPTDELHHFSEG